MRRVSVLAVLVAVFVLAFSGTAVAKYAGYAYNNPVDGEPNPAPGYLSWTGAKAIMTANGVDAELLTTPHGGYRTNSTKCAVCHSVHRAQSDATAAGVGSYWKLTPGGMSCVACHTAWGANPTPSALVEWGMPYEAGGPHRGQNCLGSCHASVHGGTASEYAAVAMWNLTNANDSAIAAAFAAGNEYTAEDSVNNDAVGRGRGIVTEESFRDYTLPAAAPQGATTERAMRAMATGYTCGAPGCHSSSQFAVNKKGYAELRASDPAASSTLDTAMTGHSTNMTYGCPPCHMNDIAFYDWNYDTIGRESGCALCHDALGKATGSTAFPHGNRNMVFLETEDGWEYTDKPVGADSANLWMYAGDATRRDATGEPSPTGTANSARKRTLIEYAAGFDAAGNGLPGNINDGTCLKCHAFKYGGGHQSGGSGATSYLKADGTPTGNTLGFSKF